MRCCCILIPILQTRKQSIMHGHGDSMQWRQSANTGHSNLKHMLPSPQETAWSKILRCFQGRSKDLEHSKLRKPGPHVPRRTSTPGPSFANKIQNWASSRRHCKHCLIVRRFWKHLLDCVPPIEMKSKTQLPSKGGRKTRKQKSSDKQLVSTSLQTATKSPLWKIT